MCSCGRERDHQIKKNQKEFVEKYQMNKRNHTAGVLAIANKVIHMKIYVGHAWVC